MKVLKLLFSLAFFLFITTSYAQFTIDAELRPRVEYRHGYKTLFPDDADPSVFVSQRSRLNFGYKTEKLHLYISPQDVRVWGDVPQLNVADNNGFSLHQAWGEVSIDTAFSVKVGRQEIAYDDQRIFGSVNWAQQGRSHDAAIVKWQKETAKVHLGAAYNQEKETLTGNILYANASTYKSLQYLWMHKDWKNFNASFLFLNNGFQALGVEEEDAETRYSQTTGVHLNYKINDLKFTSNLYYQFGNDINNNDLSAYLLALEAHYTVSDNLGFKLGGELQSGNDYGVPANGENNAFTPLYGTNHKFNGFMDYYYVGNHMHSVGLTDLYASINYKLNPKSAINLDLHQFFASAELDEELSKNLGTEIDLVFAHKINKMVSLKAGYSHYFETEATEFLKNNFDGNTNNWAWVMLIIKPELFASK